MSHSQLHTKSRRRLLLLEALAAVVVVAALKVLAHVAGVEALELNSLFTSLIAGAIFLFGLILSGTLSDYKESDRVPAELVGSLESIREEIMATSAKNPSYHPAEALGVLSEIARQFRNCAASGDCTGLYAEISRLTPVFAEMETAGALPQYVSRIRSDQAAIRRLALRTSHVQRIDFLPSAYVLLVTTVALVVTILLFTAIEPVTLSVVLISFVTFLFIYMLRMLSRLERPFASQGTSRDDVSLFLVKEFEERIASEAGSRTRGSRPSPIRQVS